MDKLEEIFKMQSALNGYIVKERQLDGISANEWIQKHIIAMLSELGELLQEINFKWWKNPKEVDNDAVKEEMVDVLHFFISMCLDCGMDAKEVYDIYIEKNKENYNRQLGLSAKDGYALNDIKK